ncbi:MAG TPA: hypothetical protein VGB55_07900 [Tepidisphaeraceae bacterium]
MQPLIDALFWLTLASWFGSALVCAVAPPIILKAIHDADPTLPRVLSVNLDHQHSTLLAGTVVGEMLKIFFRVQLVCAAVLLPALAAKWFVTNLQGPAVVLPLMVTALYFAGLAFVLFGLLSVLPKVIAHRDKYIANADDPDIANPELDHFDRHSASMSGVVRNVLFIVLGMIVFSSALAPRFTHIQ